MTDANLTGVNLANAIFCNTVMPDGQVWNDTCCRRGVSPPDRIRVASARA